MQSIRRQRLELYASYTKRNPGTSKPLQASIPDKAMSGWPRHGIACSGDYPGKLSRTLARPEAHDDVAYLSRIWLGADSNGLSASVAADLAIAAAVSPASACATFSRARLASSASIRSTINCRNAAALSGLLKILRTDQCLFKGLDRC